MPPIKNLFSMIHSWITKYQIKNRFYIFTTSANQKNSTKANYEWNRQILTSEPYIFFFLFVLQSLIATCLYCYSEIKLLIDKI